MDYQERYTKETGKIELIDNTIAKAIHYQSIAKKISEVTDNELDKRYMEFSILIIDKYIRYFKNARETALREQGILRRILDGDSVKPKELSELERKLDEEKQQQLVKKAKKREIDEAKLYENARSLGISEGVSMLVATKPFLSLLLLIKEYNRYYNIDSEDTKL